MSRRGALEAFYRGRSVVVTGHTGFKGAWLALALDELGARVTGIALPPQDDGVYQLAQIGHRVESHLVDIRDTGAVQAVVQSVRPDVVFHLAAQALVSDSFRDPVETFDVNVMGTASVLAACGATSSVRAVVAATTDKVYENDGSGRPLVESDRLGGGDPYSASKSAAEMLIASWRYSFLSQPGAPRFRLGAARAGNVIGGGDRARDRVVPDVVSALAAAEAVRLRNPAAVRPWQFVLEPVVGYLEYAARLCGAENPELPVPEALNFGPDPSGVCTVSELVDLMIGAWGAGSWAATDDRPGPEAAVLLLDSSEAARTLGWSPRLDLARAIGWTVDWYRCAADQGDCGRLTVGQIEQYFSMLDEVG